MTWNDTACGLSPRLWAAFLRVAERCELAMANKPSWQTGVPDIPADGHRGCAGYLVDLPRRTTTAISFARR